MADKDFIKNVFQRATEEFDIEFNPSAWERMEQKLDRARRRRVLFYWLRWSSLALVAILLVWLLWENATSKELNAPVSKPNIPVVEAPKTLDDPCIENQAIAKQELPGATSQKKETLQPSVSKNKLKSNKQYAVHYKYKKNTLQNNVSNIENSSIALQKEPVKNTTQVIAFQTETKKRDSTAAAIIPTENIASIALNNLKSQKTKEPLVINVDESNITPINSVRPNRWTLGISVAPEAVSVGFNNAARSGFSVGIITEYRLARRFSLSAQGVYAKKSYVAGQGDFHRSGGWLYDLEPIETSGSCNMLEATLSLRTELLQRQHWNLVATTGVSTWWMLREGYDYKYEKHYPGLVYNWQSDQSLTHWLAMAQLGIGGEIKLSQKLSAQADFYFQIPLQGVGRGNVQLYSKGLALSLRRQF